MSAGDGDRTVVVIVDGTDEVVLGHLCRISCNLAFVDALARIQLEAGRQGCSIRLRDAGSELSELLELVGLGDLLA